MNKNSELIRREEALKDLKILIEKKLGNVKYDLELDPYNSRLVVFSTSTFDKMAKLVRLKAKVTDTQYIIVVDTRKLLKDVHAGMLNIIYNRRVG